MKSGNTQRSIASFSLWTAQPRFHNRCCGDRFQPQRWRTSMWKVTVICGIMFSQEHLLLYLVLIYRPCHLREPPSLLIQGKEVWLSLTVCKSLMAAKLLIARGFSFVDFATLDHHLVKYFHRFLIEAPFSALAGVVADARDPPKVKFASRNRLS